LHVHEGQAGDQPPEVVDDDKKEGQAGDQPPEVVTDVSNPSINAPDVVVEDDNNDNDGVLSLAPMIPP
jgi:hypothetical protein